MLDDLSLRLIATLGASLLVGTGARRLGKAKLKLWQEDPIAARAKAMRRDEVLASRLAYLGTAIYSFGVVLFVELVVAIVNYIT